MITDERDRQAMLAELRWIVATGANIYEKRTADLLPGLHALSKEDIESVAGPAPREPASLWDMLRRGIRYLAYGKTN